MFLLGLCCGLGLAAVIFLAGLMRWRDENRKGLEAMARMYAMSMECDEIFNSGVSLEEQGRALLQLIVKYGKLSKEAAHE